MSGIGSHQPGLPASGVDGTPLAAERDQRTPEASFPEPTTPGRSLRPIVVAIGASAGGVAALRTLFAHVPARSGVAWIVIAHLDAEHARHLAELLQLHVKPPVQRVTDGVPLLPDHVYVVPPGATLGSGDTHLRLTRAEEHRHQRTPIDHFFRSLAATHHGRSVGVILSGTGSDGALGVKAIKERNGFTVVQDPAEAEYDGMPRSAISTGLVDRVLPLAAIPEAVLSFARTAPNVSIPAEGEALEAEQRWLLQAIFAQVRARTGRDFSRYKQSTVLRRIQRRMRLREVEELGRYLGQLREDPAEVRALADDLLITVTTFFRDPEVWQHLEAEVIPGLFDGKGPSLEVRVWCVGCATGEEAYSLAMLLMEEAARLDDPPQIRVFASDLHARSLDKARQGFYPGDIEADVSAERLRRFFHPEDGGYRVKKEVRERVVFAPHNLLTDPPFSRLDLISCRNLLIYLQREVQREVMAIFHYALKPEGVLVLGTAETVEGMELFRTVSRRHHVYRKRDVRSAEPRLPVLPMTRAPVPTRRSGAEERSSDGSARVRELEAELERSRERLQAVIEAYETSQEEMKASHEELQSANEELRSTLEELESSKQELQSTNEELQTVYQENRHRVEELCRLSTDLQNLLSATQIAILFLDRELRILRFTPPVGELFNVRPADRGRPLFDLTHRLCYDELRDDAEAVLREPVPVEREVRDERGRWYLIRVLPYRSGDGRVEGVVITLVDTTERRRAEKAPRQSGQRLRTARNDLALADALRSHLEVWSAHHGIPGDLHIAGMEQGRLPADLETILYRVAEEGLANVSKHAHATRVSLVLERRPGVVSLIVEDNGRGFQAEETLARRRRGKRRGLRGIGERVALLGGELDIQSSPGRGTTILVRLPDPLPSAANERRGTER